MNIIPLADASLAIGIGILVAVVISGILVIAWVAFSPRQTRR